MPSVKWRDPDTGEMREKKFPYNDKGKEEARRYAAQLSMHGVPSAQGTRVLERLRPGDLHPEQMEVSGNYRVLTKGRIGKLTPEEIALFERHHDPEARRAVQNIRAQEARRKAAKRAQVTTAKAEPKQ